MIACGGEHALDLVVLALGERQPQAVQAGRRAVPGLGGECGETEGICERGREQCFEVLNFPDADLM